MTGRVAGRVALVTGASSGLGKRFAQVLAAQGAKVVVAGRDAPPALRTPDMRPRRQDGLPVRAGRCRVDADCDGGPTKASQ